MTKCLTSRQLANHAKMSLDKYLNTGDMQHLKDAKLLITQALVNDITDSKLLEMNARLYGIEFSKDVIDASKIKVGKIDTSKGWRMPDE